MQKYYATRFSLQVYQRKPLKK